MKRALIILLAVALLSLSAGTCSLAEPDPVSVSYKGRSYDLSYGGTEIVDDHLEVLIDGITGLLIRNNKLVSIIDVHAVFNGKKVKASDFYARSGDPGLIYAYIFPGTDRPEEIWIEPVEGGNGPVLLWDQTQAAPADDGPEETTLQAQAALTIQAEICSACGRVYSPEEDLETCPDCGGSLDPEARYVAAGDALILGHYEQDGDAANGPEPIEWIVLKEKDGKAVLLSRYVLDVGLYNRMSGYSLWQNTDLRKWLNDAFLKDAFSGSEAALLQPVTFTGDADHSDMAYSDDAEGDRVFLISQTEAGKWFENRNDALAFPTAYARLNGVNVNSEEGAYQGMSWWWLRSEKDGPGQAQMTGMIPTREIESTYSTYINREDGGIRPAIVLSVPWDENEVDEADMPEELLAALGDGPYRDTWDALKNGTVVQKGSKGPTAQGVQQTLVELGQKITADGSAGAKTLKALNAVQQQLGLEPTDVVDAAVYEQLLLGLLDRKDPTAAGELRSKYGL